LTNFAKEDIAKLFAQKTVETGQKITAEVLDYVYEQSGGQPWVVNSLLMRATMRILDEDSRETVREEHVKPPCGGGGEDFPHLILYIGYCINTWKKIA
jgi:hypothetical protein